MTLLVTGYKPFGDYETNPSGQVARELDGETVANHEVVGRVLPVAFDRVADALTALVAEHDPAAVISTGLAAGRTTVSVERVAINGDDAVTVPDNIDDSPHAAAIADDGADAHFATIPVVETVEALLEAGVPARVSNSAGTHCCNHALYSLLENRKITSYPAVRAEVEGAGCTWVDETVRDGNLVTAQAWPDHPEWLAAFLDVLGTEIDHGAGPVPDDD